MERHWVITSMGILGRDARRLALGATVRALRLLPLAIALLGCAGSPYTVARKVVAPIDQSAIALHQEWQVFDSARGMKIVQDGIAAKRAPQEIRDQLAEWTRAGDKVEQAFAALVQELHVAKAMIDAAEAGRGGGLPLAQILTALAAKARAIADVLRLAGVKDSMLDSFLAAVTLLTGGK